MLLLTDGDLHALLPCNDCIAALEEALAGPAAVPARQMLPAGGGVLLSMPAFQANPSGLGVKIVSVFDGNPARGLARIQGLYLYLDAATGQPLALLDAPALTAIRTAAVSALATCRMANPGPDVLAVFGTGVQAKAHIEAMRAVRPVERVLVCGRTREKSEAFAARMGAEPVTPAEVPQATLICTCTSSLQPLLDGRMLRPGTHINAIGNFSPSGRELDEATIRRARVAVDTYEGAWAEAGEILAPLQAGVIGREHVLAELAEVVRREKEVRTAPGEITVFKSVGHALQDLAVARLACERARATGRGTVVAF